MGKQWTFVTLTGRAMWLSLGELSIIWKFLSTSLLVCWAADWECVFLFLFFLV